MACSAPPMETASGSFRHKGGNGHWGKGPKDVNNSPKRHRSIPVSAAWNVFLCAKSLTQKKLTSLVPALPALLPHRMLTSCFRKRSEVGFVRSARRFFFLMAPTQLTGPLGLHKGAIRRTSAHMDDWRGCVGDAEGGLESSGVEKSVGRNGLDDFR
jgi:hypothetical protein